ncbi:MAG: PEP-CTERM system histidine kinase PrsK [Gammaproteobacteria bacterium]|jgi:putative PEP-CTERM system histidine kinase|nr:PEP-CTERM system histidine kinase PrsK [Gammaproteobacteria bacterium]
MSGVAVASHISCTLAFVIVTLVLAGHRPTRTQFPILIASCAFTAIWAFLSILYAANIIQHYYVISASELLGNGLWFLSLIQLLKLTQRGNKKRWFFSRYFYAFSGTLLLGLLINAFVIEMSFNPGSSGIYSKFSFIGYVLFSVLVLALVEQLYRGTVPERRWGIKLLCIGIGLMFSYDFYMYAHAALFNVLNTSSWQVRGAILATIAPLIGLSALRHHKWQAEILPSRALIFRSTVFISCGIYLMLMAVMGYFIREWGGTWGQSLQVVFFTGSLIVLSLMLSSGKVRASAKLFISKNFFKLRYDYREEWLKFSTLLSSDEDGKQHSQYVIKALADMMESPRGILFEWEEKRGYVLKDCWSNPFPNKDMVIEPCAFTDFLQQSRRSLELPSRFNTDNRIPPVPVAIRQFNWAWLLVPLIHGNRLHAFVILAHPRVAFFNLNWEVLDLLSMAGRQAAICLVQEQNAQALAIARQFEGYNRLSAFVMHDLKNVHSQLKLIQSNKEKHENNPEFIHSVYHTIEHTADKIDRLLVQMRAKDQCIKAEEVEVAKTLQKVIQLTSHRQPKPSLDWKIASSEITVVGDEEVFTNVLCHLVENAQQATSLKGEIVLSVKLMDERLVIAIQDSGCGMDPEFIHISLYKPFVTTKGDKGMGIGVYEAREYLHTVGGKLTVETAKGQGSTFCLEFPHASILTERDVA